MWGLLKSLAWSKGNIYRESTAQQKGGFSHEILGISCKKNTSLNQVSHGICRQGRGLEQQVLWQLRGGRNSGGEAGWPRSSGDALAASEATQMSRLGSLGLKGPQICIDVNKEDETHAWCLYRYLVDVLFVCLFTCWLVKLFSFLYMCEIHISFSKRKAKEPILTALKTDFVGMVWAHIWKVVFVVGLHVLISWSCLADLPQAPQPRAQETGYALNLQEERTLSEDAAAASSATFATEKR